MNFRLWLESQNEELQIKLKSAFDQARTALIGGTADYNTALGKISLRNRTGASAVEEMLASVFEMLRSLGQYDPEISSRGEEARQWLNSIKSGDNPVNANHTVGHLLKKMFGDQMYGEFSGQPVPSSDVSEPVAGGGLGDDVTQGPEDNQQQPMMNTPLQPPNKKQIGQELATNLVAHVNPPEGKRVWLP